MLNFFVSFILFVFYFFLIESSNNSNQFRFSSYGQNIVSKKTLAPHSFLPDLLLSSYRTFNTAQVVVGVDGNVTDFVNPRSLDHFNLDIFGITFNPILFLGKAYQKTQEQLLKKPKKQEAIENAPTIGVQSSSVYAHPCVSKDIDIFLLHLPKDLHGEEFHSLFKHFLFEEAKVSPTFAIRH